MKRVAWNKGLKIGLSHPQMGFQKGNHKWENEKTLATQFKKGQSASPATQFKKGCVPSPLALEKNRARVKEKHPAWIVDRTQLKKSPEDSRYRNSPAHKEWSRNVKNRDGWKCRIADNNCNGKLVAHHILSWSKFPELRYQVNNGITLCQAHHPLKRDEEAKLSPYFQS